MFILKVFTKFISLLLRFFFYLFQFWNLNFIVYFKTKPNEKKNFKSKPMCNKSFVKTVLTVQKLWHIKNDYFKICFKLCINIFASNSNNLDRLHSGCADRSPWCISWISTVPQICRTSTVYMRQDCKSTCGFCSQQQIQI